MKKTILILALFITTLTLTFAQEKQNDATLEETVNWINEIAIPKQKCSEGYCVSRIYVKINYKLIYYSRTWNGEHHDLHHVQFNKHTQIGVEYYENNFCVFINTDKNIDNNNYSNVIRFSDKEMARRTYNAFSHLFKLLNIEVKRYNKLANENKF